MSTGKLLDFSQNSVMAYTNLVYASLVICVAQMYLWRAAILPLSFCFAELTKSKSSKSHFS